MIEKCFNCGEDIDNEVDVYSQLVGSAGTINFCDDCGKEYNIPNWKNKKELPKKILRFKNGHDLFIELEDGKYRSLVDSKIYTYENVDKFQQEYKCKWVGGKNEFK